jgi:hypothetical protein
LPAPDELLDEELDEDEELDDELELLVRPEDEDELDDELELLGLPDDDLEEYVLVDELDAPSTSSGPLQAVLATAAKIIIR